MLTLRSKQVKLPEENRPKTSDTYGRANRLASRQMAQGIGEVGRERGGTKGEG